MWLGISWGILWGLCEVGARMGLPAVCPASAMGSISTGLSFFFLAGAYRSTRVLAGPLFALLTAMLLKISGVVVLHPLLASPALINSILALASQTFLFLIILMAARKLLSARGWYRAVAGILAGGSAALIFPLSSLVSGIPVCVVQTSNLPVSIHYGYLAALLGGAALPLGWTAGGYIQERLLLSDKKIRVQFVLINLFTAACTLLLTAFGN